MRCDIKMYWKVRALRRRDPFLFDRFLNPHTVIIPDEPNYTEIDKVREQTAMHLRRRFEEQILSIEYVGGEPLRVDCLGGNLVRFVNPPAIYINQS